MSTRSATRLRSHTSANSSSSPQPTHSARSNPRRFPLSLPPRISTIEEHSPPSPNRLPSSSSPRTSRIIPSQLDDIDPTLLAMDKSTFPNSLSPCPNSPSSPPPGSYDAIFLESAENGLRAAFNDYDNALNDPDTTDNDSQLVNDNNRVGPEHDPATRPFICRFAECDKAFSRKSDLARHFRIHTNESCPHPKCGKSFIQRSALTVHFRTHTGEKPHHCETCRKAFADSSSLARHRRIHTGKRPYICKVGDCNKPFARRVTYLKHHRNHHPHIPAPSTAAGKNTLHLPQPINRGSGMTLPQVPSLKKPTFWLRSAVDVGGPNKGAVSNPPGSAVSAGESEWGSNTSSMYRSASSSGGPGGGLAPVMIPSPTAFGPYGGRSRGSRSEVTTPLTAYGGYDSSAPTPNTPLTAMTSSSNTSFTSYQPYQSIGVSPGPSSIASSSGSFTTFPDNPNLHYYSVQRSSSTGGMMPYRPDLNLNIGRAVSDPLNMRAPPYSSAPWVGGGFSAGQLSISASHQAQLNPAYYESTTATPINSAFPSAAVSPAGTGSREESPEFRRTYSGSVPNFSFQTPNSQPSLPFASVEAPTFNALNPPQPQFVVMLPMDNRLHSAPPLLQRFHSSPAVPTLQPYNTSTWSNYPHHQYPMSAFPHPSYSMVSSKEQDEVPWQHIDDQLVDLSPTDTIVPSSVRIEERKPSLTITTQSGQAWSQPTTYSLTTQRIEYPSNVISSTTSTAVNPFPTPQGLHGQRGPLSYAPLPYPSPISTPYTPGNADQVPINSSHWSQTHQHQQVRPSLGLPVDSWRTVQTQQISLFHPPYTSEQSRTLTVQDQIAKPKPGRTVSAVGLGIANVQIEVMDEGRISRESEGEEEMEDEYDGPLDEGSDEEFILGPKKKAGKKGRKGTGKKAVGGRKKGTA